MTFPAQQAAVLRGMADIGQKRTSRPITPLNESKTGMSIEAVIASLNAFVPSEESENVEQLYQYLAPLATMTPAERLDAVPAILSLIERFSDAEFGSPGPLVHELEAIPGYEVPLLDSLQRQPEGLTVWMANRILNSELTPSTRSVWLAILAGVLQNPKASELTKETAAEFLKHQTD